MKLTNKIVLQSKYKGKSSFDFWKNSSIGDEIEISLEVKGVGNNRGSLYATNLEFYNKEKGKFTCSLTQASNYLKNLEYKECQQ